jgi:putative drug exporter of the RND superfamily
VLFSGMTVVLALLGMLIVPNSTFRSLGTGAILVVIAAVAAALTLLRALLALLGAALRQPGPLALAANERSESLHLRAPRIGHRPSPFADHAQPAGHC